MKANTKTKPAGKRNLLAENLKRVLESKRAHRRELAARPVGEKLRLLDAMRERELAIRGRGGATPTMLRDESGSYRPKAK